MTKSISLLTSTAAVNETIAECDALGRDKFLKKYGFGISRKYPLYVKGKTYDSKAIAGVAYGKQFGKPLKPRDFSGGFSTVVPALHAMGFLSTEAVHPVRWLVVGQTYFRKDLLERYGGQLQAGI